MNTSEIGSTHDSGMVDKLGNNELWLRVVAPRRQVRPICLAHGVEQQVARDRDSAAEHEELGVKYRAQTRTRLPEPGAQLTQGMKRARIVVGEQPGKNATGEAARALALECERKSDTACVGDFISHPQQRAARAVLLNTAACATAAWQPIRHDTHMAEFTRSAEPAPQQSICGDDGAADTSTDSQHGHVVNIARGTEPKFGPARGVCIIVDRDVNVESFAQAITKGFVSPVDVGCVVDGRLGGIDETSRRNSRRDHLMAISQLFDHGHDEVGNSGGITRGRRLAEFSEDVSLIAHEGSGDFRSADIDSDGVHERRVYRRRTLFEGAPSMPH